MSIHAIKNIKALTVNDFQKRKSENQKISMVTCYDYSSAAIVNATTVDTVLVGDSVSMVMYGYPDTLSATVDMMVRHTEAVSRGAPDKFIIGDMPFCSYRKGLARTMDAVEVIMRAGAKAVKLEGAAGNLKIIRHIVDSGVPVIGHLGLTPQSLNTLGGFKVQGRTPEVAARIMQEALDIEQAGCCAVVLECMPSDLAKAITEKLSIPTIGIGAGPDTDGQVLVFQDLLGIAQNIKPKFVKNYLNGFELVRDAINDYDREVKEIVYPNAKEHGY